MKKNVLLTGGSGFIGKAIVLELLNDSKDVKVLTRTPLSSPPNIKPVWLDLSSTYKLEAILGDWRPDVLIHLAWAGIPDFSLNQSLTNLTMSLQLIEQAISLGCKKIILAGSCWEYGIASGEIVETKQPQSPGMLGATKTAMFTIAQSLARQSETEIMLARIFYSYGPFQKIQSLIPSTVAALKQGRTPAISNPNIALDFIEVSDVARAFITLCDHPEASSGIYNLSSGYGTVVKQVVNQVASFLNSQNVYADTEADSGFWGNNRKMLELGWQPTVSLEAGIKRYIDSLE